MTTATSITVRVPLTIRRRPGRKTVVAPEGPAAAASTRTRADPALVKALARAFRYQGLLDEGRYASISEMAGAERIDRGYLGRILQLTLLAPDIVETILDGKLALEVQMHQLLKPIPVRWEEQRRMWLRLEDHGEGRVSLRIGQAPRELGVQANHPFGRTIAR